ncbi:MAG: hypothetical protein ABL996_09390 [Micropepsaceae bacterium]
MSQSDAPKVVPPALHVGPLSAPAAAPMPLALDGVPLALTPSAHSGLARQLLQEQITSINAWAESNRREARWETLLFWALKAPVIGVSAGYALMHQLHWDWQLTVAGAISALCVLIDGLYRPGHLRNFHHRAFFQLRMLATDLSDQWKSALLTANGDLDGTAARLIDEARRRKAEISNLLAAAESVLGEDGARGTRPAGR